MLLKWILYSIAPDPTRRKGTYCWRDAEENRLSTSIGLPIFRVREFFQFKERNGVSAFVLDPYSRSAEFHKPADHAERLSRGRRPLADVLNPGTRQNIAACRPGPHCGGSPEHRIH